MHSNIGPSPTARALRPCWPPSRSHALAIRMLSTVARHASRIMIRSRLALANRPPLPP